MKIILTFINLVRSIVSLFSSKLKFLRNKRKLLRIDVTNKLHISKNAYGFYGQGICIPEFIQTLVGRLSKNTFQKYRVARRWSN